MRKLHFTPKNTLSVFVLTLLFTIAGLKSQAQVITGKNMASSDTVTYEFYGSGANFNAKRTLIFTDKARVDSLANLIAERSGKHFTIIYLKQGQEAKAISAKDFKNLDKTGIYQITVAYNKRGAATDMKPMYLLSSR